MLWLPLQIKVRGVPYAEGGTKPCGLWNLEPPRGSWATWPLLAGCPDSAPICVCRRDMKERKLNSSKI